MISCNDIKKATMTEEKKREAHNNIFAYYVGRPISYVLTIPYLYTRVSPNTITMVSMIFLVIGYLLFQFGNSKFMFIVGWFFFFMWNLYDGVDGNVARYKKQFSKNGDLWDTTAGYMAMVTTYMAAGVCASKANLVIDNINNVFFVIMGGWTAIMSIFPRLILHKKNSAYGQSNEAKKLQDKGSFSIIKVIALNVISITGFLQVIWIICIVFDLMPLFIIFYFIANSAVAILSTAKLLSE